MTRHVTVSLTGSGDELQEEDAVTAVSDTLPVLAFTWRAMPVALGIHVNESCAIPVPEVAAKVIVRGLVAQVAFGVELVANPTDA